MAGTETCTVTAVQNRSSLFILVAVLIPVGAIRV